MSSWRVPVFISKLLQTPRYGILPGPGLATKVSRLVAKTSPPAKTG